MFLQLVPTQKPFRFDILEREMRKKSTSKNVRLQNLCPNVLQKRVDVKFTSQSMINKKRVVPLIVFARKKTQNRALIGNVEIDFSQSISGVTVYWVEQRA